MEVNSFQIFGFSCDEIFLYFCGILTLITFNLNLINNYRYCAYFEWFDLSLEDLSKIC